MKFTTLSYEGAEYELVTVPVDYETTDWWLVDESGQLVKADFYECAQDEVAYYFDFWEVREFLPKEEDPEDAFYCMVDWYYHFEQDKTL